MSTTHFSVQCKMCQKEVESFDQSIKFILTETEAIQEYEVITLSCGCIIDFPDWQIDPAHGLCRIYNFAGNLFLEFYDEEMLSEEYE